MHPLRRSGLIAQVLKCFALKRSRPRSVTDVASQNDVSSALSSALESGNVPHLLFYGPPGTGKTSTAMALGKQLYGSQHYSVCVLELNASDDRGIGVVRGKVKSFASQAAPSGVKVGFRLLVLDEADAMTEDAQSALRRTMEAHSRSTRFVFCCNYVSRIIDAIASRCAKFRFRQVGDDAMHERLHSIASSEQIDLRDGCLQSVLNCSGGDMRKAITLLQSASQLNGGVADEDGALDAAGVMRESHLHQLLETIRQGKFDTIKAAVEACVLEGYPPVQILQQLTDAVVGDSSIPETSKASVARRAADADKALAEGSDESMQLVAVAANAGQIISKAHKQ